MDMNGVFSAIYDPANHQLNTTTVSATSAPEVGATEPNGVIDAVFDPATNTIRIVFV
jgi:hypothetical protein